jgi:hypothetical protein
VSSWLFCAEGSTGIENGGDGQTLLPGLLPAPETLPPLRMGYECLEAAQNDQPERNRQPEPFSCLACRAPILLRTLLPRAVSGLASAILSRKSTAERGPRGWRL